MPSREPEPDAPISLAGPPSREPDGPISLAGLPADGAAVDLIARLTLLAARSGERIRFSDPSRELAELIELAGLGHLLAP